MIYDRGAMTIDFAARLDDLYSFLNREYSVGAEEADQDAIDVLLAAQMSIPRQAVSPPIIIETDWLSRDCSTAWFAFGGAIIPRAVGILQERRARESAKRLDEWTAESAARGLPVVFVDPEWRTPRRWPNVRSGAGFNVGRCFQDCLRVRARSPKSLGILAVDPYGADARAAKLNHLCKQVVACQFRNSVSISPRLVVPKYYAYYCEIALKLCQGHPAGASWEWLTNTIARFAVRNAWLYGREETGEADWALAGRLLAWQVPIWTAGLLRQFAAGPIANAKLFPSRAWRSYVGPEAAALELKVVKKEIARLAAAGVLQKIAIGAQVPRGYESKEMREAVGRVLDGKAFVL